jgi:hypothetical protein
MIVSDLIKKSVLNDENIIVLSSHLLERVYDGSRTIYPATAGFILRIEKKVQSYPANCGISSS